MQSTTKAWKGPCSLIENLCTIHKNTVLLDEKMKTNGKCNDRWAYISYIATDRLLKHCLPVLLESEWDNVPLTSFSLPQM